MRVTRILLLTLVVVARATAQSDAPAPSPDPSIHSFADRDKTCLAWTDKCRTCTRGADDKVVCSNIGIACQPEAIACTNRQAEPPKTEPLKTEPPKTEPLKTEPPKTEPAK